MAITFRASLTGDNGSTAATTQAVTLPTGWAAGDFCVIGGRIGNSSGTFTTPTGWTLLSAGNDATGGYSYCFYYRVLQAGDANPTLTFSASSTWVWFSGSVYSSVSATLSLDADGGTASTGTTGTTFTPPSATASQANDASLIFAVGRASVAGAPTADTWTPATGWTAGSHDFAISGSNGNTRMAAFAYQLGLSSGSVAPGSCTYSTNVGGQTFFFTYDQVLVAEASSGTSPSLPDVAGAVEALAVTATVPLADVAGAADSLVAGVGAADSDVAGAVDALSISGTVPLADVAGAVDSLSIAVAGQAPSTFVGVFPGDAVTAKAGMAATVNPPGYQGGPSGAASVPVSALNNGWEIYVRDGADFTTLLAQIPTSMLLNFQFAKMLNDIGSGTVVLSQDDPWWSTVTLPGGLAPHTLLDRECLWQIYQDGVCRFEFLGETVTEQLIDASEQRQVTITGPGTIATLKWAMIAPQGFPNIVLKLDGILDSFSEVNVNGQPVIDTNIWTTTSPASHVYITPSGPLLNYPGGAGYALSTLYPSGSVTVVASPGTSFLGASPYDATDTLISAQVSPIGVNANSADTNAPAKYGTGLNGSELTQFYIQSNKNTNNYALIGLSASAFYCQVQGPGGVQTKIMKPYNATNHAYWMITEQGGTNGGSGVWYFWTSPDGQKWTLQWKVVHNWDATNVSFFYTAQYSVDNQQSAQLTNLNSNVTTPSYQGSIYLGVPMMDVWLDQLSKAQARGTVPFVTHTVTTGHDSFGRAWTDTQNVQATNGTDLYSFLQSACSVVNADFLMQPGFRLIVGQPAANQVSLGVDRSQFIILRDGYDTQTKQRVRARNQITTLIAGQNSDGHEISATSTTFANQWGKREAWYQTAAQVDPKSMAYATAAALAQNETEILSWTFTLTPNLPGRTVFKNFDVGDWLGLERPDFSAVDDVRVVGIAVQVDNAGVETHELTLISYIQWLQEQLTFISNKLGGGFVNTLGATPVAPSKYGTGQVPTWYTPAATLAGLADMESGSGGSTRANAPLVYNPATGTYQHAGTTDPVSGNVVPMVVGGPGSASTTTAQTGTVIVDSNGTQRSAHGLQPDGTYTTVDTNGPAHPAPDTPTVAGIIQGVNVTWDGLIGGAAPLKDFFHVQVHVSTTNGFTPSSATLKGTFRVAGTWPVTGLTAGTTYYVKLVGYNTSGVASPASAQASAAALAVPGNVIAGTFIAEGSTDVLAYSGTPAVGNLVASIAGAAGNDFSQGVTPSPGNNFVAGINAYTTVSGVTYAIGLNNTGGILGLPGLGIISVANRPVSGAGVFGESSTTTAVATLWSGAATGPDTSAYMDVQSQVHSGVANGLIEFFAGKFSFNGNATATIDGNGQFVVQNGDGVSIGDGNNFIAGHIISFSTSPQLINSISPAVVTGCSIANVANSRRYHIQGWVTYTGAAASSTPQFGFDGGAVVHIDGQSHFLSGGVYSNVVIYNGTAPLVTGPTLLTAPQRFEFDIFVGVNATGAGSFNLRAQIVGTNFTINSAYMRVEAW